MCSSCVAGLHEHGRWAGAVGIKQLMQYFQTYLWLQVGPIRCGGLWAQAGHARLPDLPIDAGACNG
eukprot:scaffold12381_cov24-Tisochrysis_lutea.AAC.1